MPVLRHQYPVVEKDEMPKEKAGTLTKIEDVERKAKRQEVGKARTVEELENIAIHRGYSMRWVMHIARAKGIPMRRRTG